jgi:hypothetical protein
VEHNILYFSLTRRKDGPKLKKRRKEVGNTTRIEQFRGRFAAAFSARFDNFFERGGSGG